VDEFGDGLASCELQHVDEADAGALGVAAVQGSERRIAVGEGHERWIVEPRGRLACLVGEPLRDGVIAVVERRVAEIGAQLGEVPMVLRCAKCRGRLLAQARDASSVGALSAMKLRASIRAALLPASPASRSRTGTPRRPDGIASEPQRARTWCPHR
jgi:hypothetical protein